LAVCLVSISGVSLLQGIFQAQCCLQNCKRSVTHDQYQINPNRDVCVHRWMLTNIPSFLVCTKPSRSISHGLQNFNTKNYRSTDQVK
jgi:hypothetical protein